MRIVLGILLLVVQSARAVPEAPIFGAYQRCPFHCITIQLRPDHTFVRHLDGDLYNNEWVTGTWAYLGENKIRATSPENTTAPEVKESTEHGSGNFRVVVIGRECDCLVAGVKITPIRQTPGEAVDTDASGKAEIPVCDEFEITTLGYHGRYRPVDNGSNVFAVYLTEDQVSAIAIDQVWQIEGGALYIADESGAFSKDHALTKISSAKEREIFGKAPPN